jgi:gamma-glutamyltranspeptidase
VQAPLSPEAAQAAQADYQQREERRQRANLLRDPDAVAYFQNADLTVKALGTKLSNPAYAATLTTLAWGFAPR